MENYWINSLIFRLLFDSVPTPQYIIDQNKQLYLYDSLKGVYIFDYYGALKSRIPFTGWTDFTVINNLLFGRDQQYLFRYEPGTFNLQRYPIPASMMNSRKILITPTQSLLAAWIINWKFTIFNNSMFSRLAIFATKQFKLDGEVFRYNFTG